MSALNDLRHAYATKDFDNIALTPYLDAIQDEHAAELAALRTRIAELTAALEEYASRDNWAKPYGFTDAVTWNWNREDGNFNGYDLAEKALKGGNDELP